MALDLTLNNVASKVGINTSTPSSSPIGPSPVMGPPKPTTTSQTVAQNTAANVPKVSPTQTNPSTPATDNVVSYSFLDGSGYNKAGQQVRPATTASTTTISNANKISQVPGIVNTTNQLSQTGVSTDANGNATYANGTIAVDPRENTPNGFSTGTPPNNTGLSTGGYVGDVYYAPGSQLPTGTDGNPVATTPTSPTDDKILQSLNDQKAQSDAMTASIIDSIKSQYDQLIKQQQETNAGQEHSVNNALLMGGVTGQGSSSQYAPISSAGIMQSQISYGLSQIADLNSKEQMAIIQAQQAGQNADFQLQDKINSQISSIRDTKVAAATKLNDAIAAQNKKMADQKAQATIDTTIGNLYSSGVTDVNSIMQALNNAGVPATADQVSNSLKNIVPSGLSDLVKTLTTNGAPASVIQNVLQQTDLSKAYAAAGDFAAGGSGIVGEYNFYKAQTEAEGKTPVDFNTYQNIDANRKAKAAGATSTDEKAQQLQDTLTGLENSFITNNLIAGNGTISSTNYKKAKAAFVTKAAGIVADPASYFDEQMGAYVDRTSLDADSKNNYKADYGIGV